GETVLRVVGSIVADDERASILLRVEAVAAWRLLEHDPVVEQRSRRDWKPEERDVAADISGERRKDLRAGHGVRRRRPVERRLVQIADGGWISPEQPRPENDDGFDADAHWLQARAPERARVGPRANRVDVERAADPLPELAQRRPTRPQRQIAEAQLVERLAIRTDEHRLDKWRVSAEADDTMLGQRADAWQQPVGRRVGKEFPKRKIEFRLEFDRPDILDAGERAKNAADAAGTGNCRIDSRGDRAPEGVEVDGTTGALPMTQLFKTGQRGVEVRWLERLRRRAAVEQLQNGIAIDGAAAAGRQERENRGQQPGIGNGASVKHSTGDLFRERGVAPAGRENRLLDRPPSRFRVDVAARCDDIRIDL